MWFNGPIVLSVIGYSDVIIINAVVVIYMIMLRWSALQILQRQAEERTPARLSFVYSQC